MESCPAALIAGRALRFEALTVAVAAAATDLDLARYRPVPPCAQPVKLPNGVFAQGAAEWALGEGCSMAPPAAGRPARSRWRPAGRTGRSGSEPWSPLKGQRVRCGLLVMGVVQESME